VSSDARIGDDGTLAAAAVEAPTVTLTLTPSIDAVFGLLREGTRGLSGHLKIDGDVMVAAAIGEIAQQLRWDVEEDLSRVLGDRAAHRMGEAARRGARQAREAGERAESGVRRFLVDEDPQLVGRPDMRALAAAIRSLDDAVGRLEVRLGPAARR
jgi:ubiquinone biosynthesis protein UbiJ